MVYVVAYDVEDDGLRARVAKVVEQYGRRVQWSVFECRLTPEMRDELSARLATVLAPPAVGHVRLYRVCAGCWEAALVVGKADADPREDAAVVV